MTSFKVLNNKIFRVQNRCPAINLSICLIILITLLTFCCCLQWTKSSITSYKVHITYQFKMWIIVAININEHFECTLMNICIIYTRLMQVEIFVNIFKQLALHDHSHLALHQHSQEINTRNPSQRTLMLINTQRSDHNLVVTLQLIFSMLWSICTNKSDHPFCLNKSSKCSVEQSGQMTSMAAHGQRIKSTQQFSAIWGKDISAYLLNIFSALPYFRCALSALHCTSPRQGESKSHRQSN